MRILSLAFLFLLLSASSTWAQRYTIGIVPQFPARKLVQIWAPLLQDIHRQTGIKLEFVGAKNISQFERNFLAQNYDFAYMNPYHSLMAHPVGYEPLIRDGKKKLQGILVVAKDSKIKSLKDLKKGVLALPSPNALGASVVIRADLKQIHGLNPKPLYVKTHSSVYLHVAQGLADAGGGVQRTLLSQPKAIQDKLRVIYRTRSMVPHPLVAHQRVPAQVKKAILLFMLNLKKDPKGQKLLQGISMPSPQRASIKDYLPMKSWGLDQFIEARKP